MVFRAGTSENPRFKRKSSKTGPKQLEKGVTALAIRRWWNVKERSFTNEPSAADTRGAASNGELSCYARAGAKRRVGLWGACDAKGCQHRLLDGSAETIYREVVPVM